MSHKLLQAWRFRQALTFFSLALVANNSSATSPNFRIVASWDVGHTARIPVAGEVEMIHTSGRSCWYERRILPFPEHLCPNTVIPCVILSGTIACTDHRCVRGRPECLLKFFYTKFVMGFLDNTQWCMFALRHQ